MSTSRNCIRNSGFPKNSVRYRSFFNNLKDLRKRKLFISSTGGVTGVKEIEENEKREKREDEGVKCIQYRSRKRRVGRQFSLLVKRARKWYEDGEGHPNFVMMYMEKGEIITEGPPHMESFLSDPTVLKSFKEAVVGRSLTFHKEQESDNQEPIPEEKLVVPFADANKYTWDSMVFLLPAILARHGLKGKNVYIEANRPSWWPDDVRYCSANSAKPDCKRLNVDEMRQVIGSFLKNCSHLYQIAENEDLTVPAAEVIDTPAPSQENKTLNYIQQMVFLKQDKEEDFLVTCCEGVKINLHSLYTLRDKLSDEIIDSFLLTVLKSIQTGIQYVRCAMLCLILSRSHQTSVTDYKFDSEEAIGVLNVGRRHWVLIIFKFQTGELVIFDPLGEQGPLLRSILTSWIKFLNLKGENRRIWRVSTMPHAKQRDSTSCGVFCLMFAERYLMQESNDFDSSEISVLSYRERILKHIVENPDESLLKSLCRLCMAEEPKGRKGLREIEWIGCDGCDNYWCHCDCLKAYETFSKFTECTWFCRFCM